MAEEQRKLWMRDKIFAAFLQRQFEEGRALVEASDLLQRYPIMTVDGEPPQTHIARFLCSGLVRSSEGEIVEANHFEVMINFPSDYLRNRCGCTCFTLWL